MTRKLMPTELQTNAWRRWRKKQREALETAARIKKAQKAVKLRWDALILLAPAHVDRWKLRAIRTEW
jgi:hypothetical protein